jgi:methionyl aminopeptidase
MRVSGFILYSTLRYSKSLIAPGMSAHVLDKKIENYIVSNGAIPAFKGYNGFPAASCISINDEVVHGIPYKDKILKDGDLVTVDIGVDYEGNITDAARTFIVGESPYVDLVSTTRRALKEATKAAKPNNTTGDIGFYTQRIAEMAGYKVPTNLGGHGVGASLHMPPFVPNYGSRGTGEKLFAGMYIAIEPMLFAGPSNVIVCEDSWTIKSETGVISAHFENTVYISNEGPVVLTDYEELEELL